MENEGFNNPKLCPSGQEVGSGKEDVEEVYGLYVRPFCGVRSVMVLMVRYVSSNTD